MTDLMEFLQGLVYIPKGASTFTVIANQAPESVGSKKLTPIYFPNSLTIASNGDIYFSDSMDSPPSFNEHRYYDTLSVFFLGILEVSNLIFMTHLDFKKVAQNQQQWHKWLSNRFKSLISSTALVFSGKQKHFLKVWQGIHKVNLAGKLWENADVAISPSTRLSKSRICFWVYLIAVEKFLFAKFPLRKLQCSFYFVGKGHWQIAEIFTER